MNWPVADENGPMLCRIEILQSSNYKRGEGGGGGGVGGDGYKLSAQRFLGSFGWALMNKCNACLAPHPTQRIPLSMRRKPACTYPPLQGRDCFFYRPLLSWAGNWIKIRPSKQSKGAIENRTDLASRESPKWPFERWLSSAILFQRIKWSEMVPICFTCQMHGENIFLIMQLVGCTVCGPWSACKSH